MLSGLLGLNELIILFLLVVVVIIPAVLIYQYGKHRGRLEERKRTDEPVRK